MVSKQEKKKTTNREPNKTRIAWTRPKTRNHLTRLDLLTQNPAGFPKRFAK